MENKDLQEFLEVFFIHSGLFTYEELNLNLQDAGMPKELKIVENLIDVTPGGIAIVDMRTFGNHVIFDVSEFNGHYNALQVILKHFYSGTENMNDKDLTIFIISNFEFLGGSGGSVIKDNRIHSFDDYEFQENWDYLNRNKAIWLAHHEKNK